MLSKILTLGDKIELSRKRAIKTEEEITETKRVFISQVLDIIDEDRLKIGMPMEGGTIVTLSINSRIDACFYTKGGLYQSRLIVKDRYKEGNVFILVVELTTELIKYQRRQYFRLGCTIDIKYKDISKEEYEELVKEQIFDDKLLELDGVVLDISGGGMRFVSGKRLSKEQVIMINLDISYGNNNNKYCLFGKIITSNEIPNRNGMFEHRVEYLNMNGGTREALIRYIFEEERRQRQREKD